MDERLELTSQRVRLRRWDDRDLAPFAALNADPEVMRYFPGPMTNAESDAFAQRIERHFDDNGFGFWAVELQADRSFVGFVGLSSATFPAPFTPAVEVGWRLDRRFWGRGIAGEAARVALSDGFDRLGLAEIVSFTAAINVPSRRVMEKLGMSRDPGEDFDHPVLDVGSPLRRHVLHRMTAADWFDANHHRRREHQ